MLKKNIKQIILAWTMIDESGYILTVASNYGEDRADPQDSQKGLVR